MCTIDNLRGYATELLACNFMSEQLATWTSQPTQVTASPAYYSLPTVF